MKRVILVLLWVSSLPGQESVPGEWIVTFPAGTPPRFSTSTQLQSRLAPGVYHVVRAAPPSGNEAGRWQPNYVYRAFNADPYLSKCWGLKNDGQAADTLAPGTPGVDVGAFAAWAIAPSSPNAVVAVLDSGVDQTHEELAGTLWKNPGEVPGNGKDDDGNGLVDDIHGWNFGEDNGNLDDTNGHGTFCSGIIAAGANNGRGIRGVAAESQIMVLKFLDENGLGSTAAAVRAVEYATAKGAHIINASWGGTNYDPALYHAVKRAGEAGVLFVAAAGNNGKDNDTDPKPMYPASFRLPTLLTVVALDNRDAFAKFSNFGKETTHLGAPGVRIYSTEPGGYGYGDGTSFAAPFVSGAAALLKSFFPGMPAAAIKERLMNTSEVVDYYAKEKMQSAGRLQIYNALRDIRPPRPTPPEHWITRSWNEGTPHPYVNEEVYRFVIDHPGATHLRVHFKGFLTEGCCDRVRISDRQGREVEVLSGEQGDFWSADVLGDQLVVEFRPDFSMTEYGFELDSYQFSTESTLWSQLDHLGRDPVLPEIRWGALPYQVGRLARPLGPGFAIW